MSDTAKKRSLYRAWLTRRLKGGKNCKMAIFSGLRNEYAPETWGNVRGPPDRPTSEIWLRRVEEFSFHGGWPLNRK